MGVRELRRVIVHCSATHPDWLRTRPLGEKVQEIRRWHVSPPNNWRDIGYHLLIDRDGTVAKGRPIEEAGAHVRGHNKDSVGICLIGGANSRADDKPGDHFTPPQLRALAGEIKRLVRENPGMTVHGHNEYARKACPGFRVGPWWRVKASTGVRGAALTAAAGSAAATATLWDAWPLWAVLALCGGIAAGALVWWLVRRTRNE